MDSGFYLTPGFLTPSIRQPDGMCDATDRKVVPKDGGCYAVCTSAGRVLYVGRSMDLYARIRSHSAKSGIMEGSPGGYAVAWWLTDEMSATQRSVLEWSLFWRYRPTMNKSLPTKTLAQREMSRVEAASMVKGDVITRAYEAEKEKERMRKIEQSKSWFARQESLAKKNRHLHRRFKKNGRERA